MRVTWLVSWYPSRLAPYNGDFIKRHAEAVAQFVKVDVIYVVKDDMGLVTKTVKEETVEQGNLTETIIYYHIPRSGFPLLDKWRSDRRYRSLYRTAIAACCSTPEKPSLLHVHVGMKAGVAAREASQRWKVPYVVTEHWTGFLPEAMERFDQLPFYIRNAWKRVLAGAAGISAVSATLQQALERLISNREVMVIGNVVDQRIFHPRGSWSGQPLFLHISGLTSFKQPELILQAFSLLLKERHDAQLELYGGARPELIQYAFSLGIEQHVKFFDEVPQQVLAARMQDAAGLVLFSSYETFGCVVIEAHAAGIPVVVSDIPAMRELVQEEVNGYFANSTSPPMLAKKMAALLRDRNKLDSGGIASAVIEKFGFDVIGRQFYNWYQSITAR